MVVPFVSSIHIAVLRADRPTKVSCSVFVSLGILLAVSGLIRNEVFIAITASAMWVCAIFYDVMVV